MNWLQKILRYFKPEMMDCPVCDGKGHLTVGAGKFSTVRRVCKNCNGKKRIVRD